MNRTELFGNNPIIGGDMHLNANSREPLHDLGDNIYNSNSRGS